MVPNFVLLIIVMSVTPQAEDRIYNLAFARLLAEYQQRFSIWTAYLGVFARPSQCLDRRLQTLHDIRDIVLRLLGLIVVEPSGITATDDAKIKTQDTEEALKSGVESLTEIEETLDRLNRLGVAIRQSARLNLNHRVKLFAQNVNVKDYEHLFANIVQVLYPNAHPSLRSRLARSMTDRLARIVFLKSRQLALATRRNEQPQQMAGIPEDEAVQEETAPTAHVPHHPPPTLISQDSLPQPIGPRNAFSDLSSLDTSLFRSRLNNIWRPNSKTRKTSSTQIKYENYPRPPNQSEGEMVVCEWCSQPLNKEDLDPMRWRRHVDRDLEPYICLSEGCAESSAGFSTFEDWSDHMQTHDNHYTFGDPENLLSHMQETHIDQFSAEQIQIISRRTSRQTDQSVAMEISSDVVDSDDAFSSSRDEDLPPSSILNDHTSVEPDPLTSSTIPSYQDSSTRRSNDDSLQQVIPPESEDLGKWGDVPRQGEVLAELEAPALEVLTTDTGDTNEETAMGSDDDSTDESTVDNDGLSNQGIPIQDNRQRSVDGALFQRASLVRSPTPRGSLLTLMMEQNKRLQSPGDRASQSNLAIPPLNIASNDLSLQGSPKDSYDNPFAMEGSINTTLATEVSIGSTPTLTHGIPIVDNASDMQGQAALSPRTTRRNMLETELTESLRRHLLWERQQRPTNVILKDSNTSDHVTDDKSCDDPDEPTEEPSPLDIGNVFTFSNDEWTYF
ncbi:uncharacterized protein T069G_11237 [Trichoderma breve]|uniref:DUF3295 domain-containing protein n=1 Tax=Trichoderma breve TaxID=2034170 RepID=A0A9W9B2A8_9HYPO|nr:uncharacterized protein T069G_11237 [Trichoderma breve]KAJ4854258.1 hypothetical protein T069G_11237 [Trichoderma breve]